MYRIGVNFNKNWREGFRENENQVIKNDKLPKNIPIIIIAMPAAVVVVGLS